ncbi:hypothetical protein [Metabacillus sp. cB07]|uniref:hypothetical protein n=1 Tax=Metabacillus sp. cB07 TaxID=2806989 RepID=UPI0019397530|nr:hypothetical protein [Metabacillus sp. cB07]
MKRLEKVPDGGAYVQHSYCSCGSMHELKTAQGTVISSKWIKTGTSEAAPK